MSFIFEFMLTNGYLIQNKKAMSWSLIVGVGVIVFLGNLSHNQSLDSGHFLEKQVRSNKTGLRLKGRNCLTIKEYVVLFVSFALGFMRSERYLTKKGGRSK